MRWPARSQQVAHIVKELPATVGTLGGAAGSALQGALANSKLFGGKGGSGNLALAPKTAVQRLGDPRAAPLPPCRCRWPS